MNKNPLAEYGYKPQNGFISVTTQLVEAQDRNTEAIKEQTQAIIAQTATQTSDASSFRTLLSDIWESFKNLFKTESDETQKAIEDHNTDTQSSLSEINQSVKDVDSSVDATTGAVSKNTNDVVQAIRNHWGN